MKRIAMVKDGVVDNIAAWDGISDWNPEGYQLIDISDKPSVDIGDLYDGSNFSKQIQGDE